MFMRIIWINTADTKELENACACSRSWNHLYTNEVENMTH